MKTCSFSDVDELRKDKAALAAYAAELETAVKNQHEKIQSLTTNQEVLERSRKAEIFKLAELVKQSEQKLTEKTRTAETLEAQLQATQTALHEKDARLKTSAEDRAKLQNKFNDLKKGYELAHEHCKELKVRIKEQTTVHLKEKETIKTLEEEIAEKDSLIVSLTEETRQLANSLSKCQADHQQQLSFAQSGMAGLHAQIADLKKTIKMLELQDTEKLDSLFNNSLTVGQFANLKRALEKAEEHSTVLEKTLTAQNKTLELKELGIKNLQAQVLALKGEISILKANAPSDSDPKRSSLSKQSFQDLQKLVTTHLHEIHQGEAEIQRLKTELIRSLEWKKELEARNGAQAVTIKNYQETCAAFEMEVTCLEVEKSNLGCQLKHCQDSYTAVSDLRDEDAKAFRKKLKKQKAKNDKLRRKIKNSLFMMDFRDLYPSFKDQL